MYERELQALKRAGRFRERKLYPSSLTDLASNDYLGLSYKRKLLKKAYKRVKKYPYHSSKASLLVNGYHPIHKEFEEYIKSLNGFESAIVVGSGFLANLSLIESLVRRKDILIMDEKYHASGIFASKSLDAKIFFFSHNDPSSLEDILKRESFQRAIVAVEGVYSMDGDILNKEIFKVCDREDTLLIVDEAHSVGVLGERLLGVFEYYGTEPKRNHIKMGTLGKALGSYGAYILSSKEIEEYLLNRAKPIIYATAPSVFDIALALEGMKYIQKHRKKLISKIRRNQKIVKKVLGEDLETLILKVPVKSNEEVLRLREKFLKKGFLIGAIRPPTVDIPMLRIIPRLKVKKDILKKFLKELKREI